MVGSWNLRNFLVVYKAAAGPWKYIKEYWYDIIFKGAAQRALRMRLI